MAPAFRKLMLTWRGTQRAAKEKRGRALWMRRSRTLGPACHTDIHRGFEAGGQETRQREGPWTNCHIPQKKLGGCSVDVANRTKKGWDVLTRRNELPRCVASLGRTEDDWPGLSRLWRQPLIQGVPESLVLWTLSSLPASAPTTSQVISEEKGREVQHPGKWWWIKRGISPIQRVQRGVRWRRGRQWKAARLAGFRAVSTCCFISGCQGSWQCVLSSPQTPLTLLRLFQVKVSFPWEGDKW